MRVGAWCELVCGQTGPEREWSNTGQGGLVPPAKDTNPTTRQVAFRCYSRRPALWWGRHLAVWRVLANHCLSRAAVSMTRHARIIALSICA